jgi:phage I-like protein
MKTQIAALTLEITATTGASREVKIFPAGEFRSSDSRPAECAAWVMNAALAQNLITTISTRKTDLHFDYEHQVLRAKSNGQPAPASAWFHTLEWREGDGLYAVDVEWTAAAQAMIEAREYRYVSPLFPYNPNTGEVLGLINVALTNLPALDDLGEVAVAAASLIAGLSQPVLEDTPLDEEMLADLLSSLRWTLNLPVTSTAEEIKAELQKVIDAVSGGQGVAATSQGLLTLLTDKDTRIAELSAKAYDPAKYVPVEALIQTQAQIVALQGTQQHAEVDTLVVAALSDGRLIPALEDWAKDLGRSDIAALRAHLDKAPAIAALNSLQSGGKPPAGARSVTTPDDNMPDDVDVGICSMMGVDPADVAKYAGENHGS